MPGSASAGIVVMVWSVLILGTAATTTVTNQSSTTKQQQHSQLRHHGRLGPWQQQTATSAVAEDITTRRRTQEGFSSPFAPGGILNPTAMDGAGLEEEEEDDNDKGQQDFVRDGHADSTEILGRQEGIPTEPGVLPCGTLGAKSTLYNLLCSESEFSFFCGPNQYRNNFGVVDLNNFTAHYTVWAPTNQAWQTLLSTGDPAELEGSFTNLLEYHVSEGLHYQQDLQCGANTTSMFFEQPHQLSCRDRTTLNGPDYERGTLNTDPDNLPQYDASTYNPDVADNAFIRGCNGIMCTYLYTIVDIINNIIIIIITASYSRYSSPCFVLFFFLHDYLYRDRF